MTASDATKAGDGGGQGLALDGTVWLTIGGALLGGRNRIGLLRAVHATGSITKAAKATGISYKAAWDAVDAMNNLAGDPLVARSTGGRGGGSTVLTARGLRLVERFDDIEALHRRFVEQLDAGATDLAAEIDLLRNLSMKTSARNQFGGEVVALRRGAVNDEVELRVAGGQRLVANITHESVESLGLAVGVQAFALVKASNVILATNLSPGRVSARNQLAGVVTRVARGAVNDEVVLAIGEASDGPTIAATVTHASVESLGLAEGTKATAIFKASSVIVGVVG